MISKNNNRSSNINGSNFLITVYNQENHSYQGVIEWLDTGKKLSFRSELEMSHLIRKALETTSQDDNSLRNWDAQPEIRVI